MIFRVALVILNAGWLFWPWLWAHAFYQSIAISFVLFFWLFYKNIRIAKRDSLFALLLASGNLIDEFFFDPTVLSWNECVLAGFLLVLIIINYKKNADPA